MSLQYVSSKLYWVAFVLWQSQQSTPTAALEEVNKSDIPAATDVFHDSTYVIGGSMIFTDFSSFPKSISHRYYGTNTPDLSESTIIETAPVSYLWKDVYFLWDQLTSLAKQVTLPEFIRPKSLSAEERVLNTIFGSYETEYEGHETDDGFILINPKEPEITAQ